jgi:hypothetical protein
MAEKTHWPFGEEADPSKEAAAKKHQEQIQAQAYLNANAAHRLRMRNDRLIVGGRAHTKKPGLS